MARRAIDLALDLARAPALARSMREQTLPPDILDVIRFAAGCPETIEAVVATTREPVGVLRAAAVFYLQEILFFPGADLYRHLGVAPGASRVEMRLHMRWLMQWLHPDHNADETAALLAERVLQAWHELGRRDQESNGEVRSASVALKRASSSRRRRNVGVRWIPIPIETGPSLFRRGANVAILALVCAAVFVTLFVPDSILFGRHPLPREGMQASAITNGVTLIDVKSK